ncbi:MAG TPA: hypothetical protein VGI81_22525 [Tepidisphaeraceae bacterium]|jgi:hypothetical protein
MIQRLPTVLPALPLLLLCIAGCNTTATDPKPKPPADRRSHPQSAPATSQAAEDPDAGRPEWVKIYNMPRKVIVTDEAGRPLAGCAVHVVSANMDFLPDQLTGDDGGVLLRRQIYIDPPQWVSVLHGGYEWAQVDYPRKWPLHVTLHKSK